MKKKGEESSSIYEVYDTEDGPPESISSLLDSITGANRICYNI